MTDSTFEHPMDLDGFKTCLMSKDPGVRFRALKAALKHGERRCVDVIVTRAHREPTEEVRVAMIKVAAMLGTPEQFQKLLPLVDDPLPGVRMVMARALVQMRHAPFFSLLVRLMGDQDIAVREFCGKVLLKIGKDRLVQLLETMAASKVDWMRLASVSACRQFRSRRLYAVLERAMSDRNEEIRFQAKRGLERFAGRGDSQASAILEGLSGILERPQAPPATVPRALAEAAHQASKEDKQEQSRVVLMPDDILEASQTSISWGDFQEDASSIDLPSAPTDLVAEEAKDFSLESEEISPRKGPGKA